MVRTGKWIRKFGDWVVTKYGVECTSQFYQLDKERLFKEDWVAHMKQKPNVDIDNFTKAYECAKELYAKYDKKA